MKILVVDGDILIRSTLGQDLRKLGFQVTECSDGNEALTRIREAMPDVVLLDIVLDMSGIEIARRLREQNVPFVFLSALNRSDIVIEAIEQGAWGYFVKPVRVESLLPNLRIACARAAELQALSGEYLQTQNTLVESRLVHAAVGIIVERHRVSMSTSLDRIYASARDRSCTIPAVASEIVATIEASNQILPLVSPLTTTRVNTRYLGRVDDDQY